MKLSRDALSIIALFLFLCGVFAWAGMIWWAAFIFAVGAVLAGFEWYPYVSALKLRLWAVAIKVVRAIKVEGKFLNAMVSRIEATGGVPTRKWRRDELPQAHEQAVKAAQQLAELVERIKAEQQHGSPPNLNPIP